MARTLGTRAEAARVLAAVLAGKGSLTRLLPEAGPQLESRDRALLAEFCFGVCRFYPRLQGMIQPLLKKPLKAKDRDIECLLLLGGYQLSYMRIPDHAALAETVAAARQLGKPWATAFINGVLRQYQRRHRALAAGLDEAAALSHPHWLLDRLKQQWPQHWESIVAANNHPPPMTLRVNRQQLMRDAYLQLLQDSGIEAEPCPFSADGIQLGQACEVTALPRFEEGACSVQDEASQLVAPLLAPEPGQRILDACAAPGGKTCHILERYGETCTLDAVEIDPQRLPRIEQNLRRLQLAARVIQGDASQPESWWDGQAYDQILVDAPCSASGVIRRHPDIKLLRQPADLASLHTQQLALLHSLWRCLKPGGRLLYTTCSVLQEENDASMGAFLQSTGDASCERIEARWGQATRYGRQMLPCKEGTDGFYYALCSKRPREAVQAEDSSEP